MNNLNEQFDYLIDYYFFKHAKDENREDIKIEEVKFNDDDTITVTYLINNKEIWLFYTPDIINDWLINSNRKKTLEYILNDN